MSERPLVLMEDRVAFAWKNFEDQQAIIRAADLKAGYLVTFLLFFGASTIPLGKEVLPDLRWARLAQDVASGLYALSYAIFAVGFVWALYLISHVLMPRIARHHAKPRDGRELLYYEHVVRYESSTAYYEAMLHANEEEMLRNVTDQVYELSMICKVKVDSLRAFSQTFKITLVAWFISTATGFWIMTYMK
ncbi:MAG TPA: Pycsar system effector family protein [Candidatus Acidoferrum sp.]|nr:Pycsar system effector family protein [Candidatus Acidoferrum sp.]